MIFLTERLIYTINIWFNFVFGSFFEQDYLSNLIILGFMQKDDQMFTYFKIETDVTQNLMDDFFFILTVRGPFHRKDFKWKKTWSTVLISEKTKVL